VKATECSQARESIHRCDKARKVRLARQERWTAKRKAGRCRHPLNFEVALPNHVTSSLDPRLRLDVLRAFLPERERRPPITNDSNPPNPSKCQYQQTAVRRACRHPNTENTSSSCAIHTHFSPLLPPALLRAAKSSQTVIQHNRH